MSCAHRRRRLRLSGSTWSRSTGRAPAASSSEPLAGGPLERLAACGPGSEDLPDPLSPEARAHPTGSSATRTGSDRRTGSRFGSSGRAPSPRLLRLEPGLARCGPAGLDGGVAADRASLGVAGERGDQARSAALREGRLARGSSTTRPARTRTALRLGGRSSAGSSSTTCAGITGTTSATTFSSIATARSSRGAPAGSKESDRAQAQGFNAGSVGVALIGNYNTGNVTSAERKALVSMLAWRLDVAHVDPLERSTGCPAAIRNTEPGRRSSCGRDLGPPRYGFTSCRGRGSTRSCPRSLRTWRRPGCRSSTPPL